MGVITGMFDKYKNAFIGIVVIGFLFYCWFFVSGLYKQIDTLTASNVSLLDERDKLKKTIVIRELTIGLKENSITELTRTINKQNNDIENIKVNNLTLNKTITDLKNTPPSIKYITKIEKATCLELETTVKTIQGLKYEDL